ncbi:MAG: transglutaminase domain-containing protein [Spirochaetales bacterium]|nr:MAG: transglutaminase domain-containing protein [Spirochaetales bacterium]
MRRNQPNPYRLARLAYQYTLDSLTYAIKTDDRSVLTGLESGYGDDFTYAALFVTLARVLGVPARVVGGVVLSGDDKAYQHFWGEFFIQTIGWVPVDPAFADDGFPGSFPIPEDPDEFYFGGLDAHRVTFLRGYDPYPVSSGENRLLQPDDPYSIQAVYAEVGPGLADPVIQWETPRPTAVYRWAGVNPAD